MQSVFSRWALVAALVTASLAANASDLELQTGEIRLDGNVRSVNSPAKSLVMDAISFSLPSGKGNRFSALKSKSVEISASTFLHVRGDEKRVLTLREVKVGAFLIVIGADNGSGKSLPAREIVVWDREANGQYFYATQTTKPDLKTTFKPTVKPTLEPSKPKAAIDNLPTAETASVLNIGTTPILQIRVKTVSANNISTNIVSPSNLTSSGRIAPGAVLPPAPAKPSKPSHIFMFALTTPQQAPRNATATLEMPAETGFQNTTDLRVSTRTGMLSGAARVINVEIYHGVGTAIGARQSHTTEINRTFFGYLSHQVRPPETFAGAGSVALPLVNPRPIGAEPVAPPEIKSAVGDYALQTSYAGEVRFHIAVAQDFMQPLQMEWMAKAPDFSKPLTLTWKKVTRALGYRVRAMGVKQLKDGRSVGTFWTSSRIAPTGVEDEQVFDDTTRAVKDGLLLNSKTNRITIPAGVLTNVKSASFIVEAFGPVQTVPGSPAVRVIPMSESIFNLPLKPNAFGAAVSRELPSTPHAAAAQLN